jgi:threonine aldolase
MNFASDNTAGIAPGILKALTGAAGGYAMGYGNDDLTRRVERRLCDLFERDVAVFFVSTGTAANALALAHVTPSWGAVLCHDFSHIVTSECGAPEFFGGGLKLIGLPGQGCKLTPDSVASAIARYSGHVPHQMNAACLSLTQASEAGTLYRAEEIAALSEVAHRHGLAVHMDGARFANALARMNVSPAEATWKAGVDVLSFGATKGGAMAAEAVVFFDPARAAAMPERRKRGGHLVSKHRYISAQFDAFLADGYWLQLARHANAMADRLADVMRAAGVEIVWPVEANLVFALLPEDLDRRLRAAGAAYYGRRADMLTGKTVKGEGKDERLLARFVTSFATTPEDIENFARLIQKR